MCELRTTCFYVETHLTSFLSYLRRLVTVKGQPNTNQIMFPVDLPALQESELLSSAEIYLSSMDGRPHHECFQSSKSSKVPIRAENVRQLQLFEDDQPPCVVLALHPPEDQTQVVALYVQDRWWPLDEVLRTSSQSRSGLVQVRSLMERVVVFLLSQVVERPLLGEISFALHPRTESCKVLWRDNQAVGFYSIKPKGSLCDGWSGSCYLLPVLDTLLCAGGSCSSSWSSGGGCTRWRPRGTGPNDETSGSTSSWAATRCTTGTRRRRSQHPHKH
ncbi:soluble lamin-associated protein of 75 kDa isoform X8 [Oryzias latipes]|uniref:soluble lamin-associated protein of 75 kDa isoform X8 n=1 Tax=Oryzias latipes TaxID=8090 RepID=UPI0009D9F22A|nr:soluble lamin-associated protein of 75 kDa isoform X8 [Oryzias latipes]